MIGVVATAANTDTFVSYTVLPYVTLSIGSADYASHSQQTLAFPSLTDADWERGYVEQNESVDLTVVANTSWTLTSQLLSPVRWIGSGLGPEQNATLSWTVLPSGDATDLVREAGQTPQIVASGDRGMHQFSLRYRVDLQSFVADSAGIEGVEAVVLYTVVAD